MDWQHVSHVRALTKVAKDKERNRIAQKFVEDIPRQIAECQDLGEFFCRVDVPCDIWNSVIGIISEKCMSFGYGLSYNKQDGYVKITWG